MKLLITLTIGGVILCMTPAFAGLSQDATVTGTIIKFDKKTVTLSQRGGLRTVVSRKSIPKHFKIKTGNRVSAVLSSDRIIAAIKEAKNKKNQKSKNKTNHSK